MKKFYSENRFTYGLDAYGDTQPNGPSKGAGADNRVGDSIEVISLDIVFSITYPGFTPTALRPNAALNYSFWVFLDAEASDDGLYDFISVPTDSANPSTGVFKPNDPRKRVLWSHSGTIERDINSYFVSGVIYNHSFEKQSQIAVSLQMLDFHTRFDTASTQGRTIDCNLNALRFGWYCDVVSYAGVANPDMSYQCVCNFNDRTNND